MAEREIVAIPFHLLYFFLTQVGDTGYAQSARIRAPRRITLMNKSLRLALSAAILMTVAPINMFAAVMGTNPHPQAVMGTNPHPQAVMGTNPHPQAVMGTNPHPQAVMGTNPHPQAVMGTDPHPQMASIS
jgi:hypothetical protein